MFHLHAERRAGLECGATGAKLVLLTRRNGEFQVAEVFLEEAPFETRVKGKARPPLENVRRLFLHKNLAGCKTVFTAAGAMESCFVILPKMEPSAAEGAILLQARKQIAWDGAAPIVAHVGSDFLRDRVGSLVGLADWKSVQAWCRLVEASGGVVEDATLGACAYQALAKRQRWTDEFPVCLVADLGATSSTFYLLDRTAVRFMRRIPMGGDALTRVLTTVISTPKGAIQLSDGEAEEVKISGCLPLAGANEAEAPRAGAISAPGGPAAGTPASGSGPGKFAQFEVLIRPLVERLGSEIARSIQFYKDNVGQKVDAVFLTGGAAGLRVLQTQLEAMAQVPVRMIDPFAGLTFVNPGARSFADKHKMRLALAAGLALAEHPAISLLPKSIQALKRFAGFVPKTVAALLLLGFAPLLAGGTYFAVKAQMAQTEIRQVQEELQQAEGRRQRLATLQQQLKESSDHAHALRSIIGRDPLWAGVLNALADALPPEIVLTRFSVSGDAQHSDLIMLEGRVLPTAAGFDNAMAALLPALSASIFFRQVNIVHAQAERTDAMLGTFEIKCELVR